MALWCACVAEVESDAFRSLPILLLKRRRTLSLTWIRGPEGLSALGTGAIEVFEAHAGLTSRRAFYEASQMGLPALPSWDEAQASWLAALNSLGRILGWSQIDSLESFQWMPYEDGP